MCVSIKLVLLRKGDFTERYLTRNSKIRELDVYIKIKNVAFFFFTFRNYEGISAGNRAWSKGLCVHWLQTEEWAFWRDNSRLNKRNHRKGKFKITLICTIYWFACPEWHIYDPAPIAVVSWSLCTAVFPTFLTIFRGISATFQIMQYSQTSKLIKITWLATYFQRTFIFFLCWHLCCCWYPINC